MFLLYDFVQILLSSLITLALAINQREAQPKINQGRVSSSSKNGLVYCEFRYGHRSKKKSLICLGLFKVIVYIPIGSHWIDHNSWG